MKVVIDTNIIVASYLAPAGSAAQILALWRSGALDLLVSEPILGEYERILSSPRIAQRHRMTPAEIVEDMDGFREYATLVEPNEALQVVDADPDDDKFFECAAAGGAAYIVSRDEHVLAVREFRGIRVLSPEAFLTLVGAEGDRR
jgi:hypothetical protein